jgi:endo-1,4-beta-xylanase
LLIPNNITFLIVYDSDYNIEGLGPKATAMLNLVKSLKASGVPIDGVGFQCAFNLDMILRDFFKIIVPTGHFIVGEVPTTIQQNMEAFVAAGVEVAITELDIRMTLPPTPELYEQQKTDYETVGLNCLSYLFSLSSIKITKPTGNQSMYGCRWLRRNHYLGLHR